MQRNTKGAMNPPSKSGEYIAFYPNVVDGDARRKRLAKLPRPHDCPCECSVCREWMDINIVPGGLFTLGIVPSSLPSTTTYVIVISTDDTSCSAITSPDGLDVTINRAFLLTKRTITNNT